MMGDVVTIDNAYGKESGTEWEVIAYNYSPSCESHTMVCIRKRKGKKKLTLDRNWLTFVHQADENTIYFDDDIPF